MTCCRIPEFCKRYKINMGIYKPESKRNLPRSVKQRDKCLYIHRNHYCVTWQKNRRDSLLIGIKQIDRVFKYIKNIISEINLTQRIRYRFPKHETIDQLENVFMFDIETHNDQEFAEAYAAGLYDENGLRDKWDRDVTVQEMKTERENVTIFAGPKGNPVMNMLKYISESYELDESFYIDKDGDEIVGSHTLLLVAHNSSAFGSWVVLNSLVKEITELKIIKTARGLISLSFRC